jgi:hypothetical protein
MAMLDTTCDWVIRWLGGLGENISNSNLPCSSIYYVYILVPTLFAPLSIDVDKPYKLKVILLA